MIMEIWPMEGPDLHDHRREWAAWSHLSGRALG